MKNSLLFREAIKAILAKKIPSSDVLLELQRNEEIMKKIVGQVTKDQFVLLSERAVMTAGSSGLIATDIGFEATSQDEMATVRKAGALFITGRDDLKVPQFGLNSFAFTAENSNAPDAPDVDDIAFGPSRIAGYKDVSALFYLNGNEEMADLNLRKALTFLDMTLDAAVFGVQARSTTIPQGMGYKITTGQTTKGVAVVPTWSTILTLEGTVAAAKALRGKLAYVTSPAGAKILKETYRDTGTTHFILENNLINGYPCFICDQVSDAAGSDDPAVGSLLVFGAWQDIAVRDYGLIITVDRYSQAIANKVRLIYNWIVDVRGLRGESSTGTTDAYEYANSFASVAIKAAS